MQKKKLTPEEEKLRSDKEALKRYLGQVFAATSEKRTLQKRLFKIRNEVTSIGGRGYSPLPNSANGKNEGAASYTFRLGEIEQRIYDQNEEIEKAILRVMDIMDFLPVGSPERKILEYRYIDCMSWKAVCKAASLTRTPCNDHLNRGIEKLLSFRKVQKIVREFQEKDKTGV